MGLLDRVIVHPVEHSDVSVEGAEDQGFELLDVKWNSQGTAERTLATMSGVELRKRLRSARGRL